MKTIQQIIAENSISTYDCQCLIAHTLNVSLSEVKLNPQITISATNLKKLNLKMKKREAGCPLDRILKKAWFWDSEFIINKNVLSPRSDSETVVEMVLKHFNNTSIKPFKILDLAVGSGCIIITLLKIYAFAQGTALDICPLALSVARQNRDKNHLKNRLRLIKSDWFDKISEKYDLITANPPYIKTNDINALAGEVKNYDPKIALDGGLDGLDYYRKIAKDSKTHLRKNGIIILELGIGQDMFVKEIFLKNGFLLIDTKRDLAAILRVQAYRLG